MSLHTLTDPRRFAAAWHSIRNVTPTDVGEMQAAMQLASREGIDYCDALERVRGQAYALAETLDGQYPSGE